MGNIDKTNELLANLTTKLSKEATDLIYLSNNIKYDKCNLYSDVIQSLLLIVFDTYMGDDITNQEDRLSHYKWCFNNNLENFKKENVVFKDTNELYDYFAVFLFERYYLEPNKIKNIVLTDKILNMWLNLFNMNVIKTPSDVDSFLELYKIMEKSLMKQ